MVPPFEKHALANELKPWGEFQRLVLEHILEIGLGDVACISDFVRVNGKVDVRLDKEDVVNL